jgi:NAD(P)H-nitrite reductase large subunit
MKSKNGFIPKLDKPSEPEIIEMKPGNKWGEGMMVIPTPRMIQQIIRSIPDGMLITNENLRNKIALDTGSNIACPLTTGIFTNIVAHASEEAVEKGDKSEQVNWWRIIQKDGTLNPKFPGGISRQAELLEKDGFQIFKKTEKKYFVVGWEQFLYN